jgi:hypothetical protein
VIGVGHVGPHKTNLLWPETLTNTYKHLQTPTNTWKYLEIPGNTWKQQNDQPARGWKSFHRHANIERYRYRPDIFMQPLKYALTRRKEMK